MLEETLSEPELMKSEGRVSREMVENRFSCEEEEQRLAGIYRKLLSDK